MSFYVYRNFTIEPFFEKGTKFSGYDEFNDVPTTVQYLVWCYFLPIFINEKQAFDLIKNYLDRLNYVLSRSNDDQTLIVFTLSSRFISVEIENATTEIKDAINYYNHEIQSISNENNRVKWIYIDDFFKNYSNDELIDWKYYYLSKMILAPNLAVNFKNWFEKKLKAINFIRKKCLILDLDNTLWGGVWGEDGIEGVKLGGDYPGNVFKEFQLLIKSAANAGVILAICSKNNLSDVKEIWEKHPEIILKEEDFSSIRVNWSDKASNILEISKELNIGLDSMVFIDDNPRERNRVISELPTVIVPDFPDEPYKLIKFFNNIYNEYFQVYNLTKEDARKTEQYRDNAKRSQLEASVGSMDDYIRNLHIELSFFVNVNVPRVAQMTQKTNQFNLTTQRYLESNTYQFIKLDHFVFSLGVRDKFGDNGITAAAIIIVDNNNHSAIIDSFLLSCRILGKDIERVFLQLILNHLLAKGITIVSARYIPSKKNSQTINFFDDNDFTVVDVSNGEKNYKYEIKEKLNIDSKYNII